MEWTHENVINLIDLYRDHPVLWDCRLKEYKNRNKRLDALVEIANFFGTEKDEIERKIKNLVSHLSRELKKEKESMKSGTGADGVYRSKWFCYNNLMFLKERNRRRGMTDTLMQDQTTSEEAEVTREEVNEQAEESDLTSEVVGKKRKTLNSPYSSKATEEALSIMKEIQGRSKNVKTDQFTAFGEQVGLRIRDLPSSHSQNMVKHLISNILFEAEMGSKRMETEEPEIPVSELSQDLTSEESAKSALHPAPSDTLYRSKKKARSLEPTIELEVPPSKTNFSNRIISADDKDNDDPVVVERLIQLVKEHPILYKQSQSDKCHSVKDKLWTALGKQLNEDGSVLKRKWENLRDNYTGYLKAEESGNPIIMEHWPWTEQMAFIRPFLQPSADTCSPAVTVHEKPTDGIAVFVKEEYTDKSMFLPEGPNFQNPGNVQLPCKSKMEIPFLQPSASSISVNSSPETERKESNVGTTVFVKEEYTDDPMFLQEEPNFQNPGNVELLGESKIETSEDYISPVDKVANDPSHSCSSNLCVGHDDIDLIYLGHARAVKKLSARRQALVNLQISKLIRAQELDQQNEYLFQNHTQDNNSSNFQYPFPSSNFVTEVGSHYQGLPNHRSLRY